ncbi:MAG: putative Ig domain-containing protein, partial [Mariniphaga sp.]
LVVVSKSASGPGGSPFGAMAAWGNAKITYSGNAAPKALALKSTGDEPIVFTPKESDLPKINYPKVIGATPEKPFIFTIPATGKKPLLFTIDKLPEGLKLDKSTGIISGTSPSKKGSYPLNITVKNSLGVAKDKIELKVGDLLALTPPMGWNSWNAGGMSVDQVKIRAAVDVISDKLRGHGWGFVNIDDGWQADKRTDDGELFTNQKFSDIKGMSDYIHSKGLRFGIYSSPGPRTCGQALGSYQHELQDAITWGSWGVDYLKYDWCSYRSISAGNTLEELEKPYKIMQDALAKTNRDIVYSLCQYGMGDVWKWGPEVNGNLWRTTMDITDNWKSILNTGFKQTENADYVNPGHWNDPDMLVIGSVGWSAKTLPTKLTKDEQYSHVSLWSLLSSPLLIGCDLTKLDDFTLGLVTNDEVIGVNQDILGRQAKLITKGDDYQVWAKDLADGSKAVGIFYTGATDGGEKDPVKMINWDQQKVDTSKLISLDFTTLGLAGKQIVRNLWSQRDLGTFDGKFETKVSQHGVTLVKLTAAK